MRVLGLDVSTKVGFAVFDDGKPTEYGTLFPDKELADFGQYPASYVYWANYTADRLYKEVISKYNPDVIVIEESNASSKSVYSQKVLEFIHYSIINMMKDKKPIYYIRTGEWRKSVEAKQNAEEKKLNTKISRDKAKRNKEIDADKTLTDAQKAAKKKLPIKIDGKVVGKKTRKHTAIRVVKELFGYDLRAKDEDASDALLLALAYIKGCAVCDGKSTGGNTKKETE